MKISGTKYKDVAVKLTDLRRIYNDICTIFDLTEAAELNELADAVMATALRSYHEGLLVQLFLTETDPKELKKKVKGIKTLIDKSEGILWTDIAPTLQQRSDNALKLK